MTGAIYTIVFDYCGGTYVSQAVAASPHSAIIEWGRTVDLSVMNVSEAERGTVVADLEEKGVVPLDGLVSVWCSTVLLNNILGTATIVL